MMLEAMRSLDFMKKINSGPVSDASNDSRTPKSSFDSSRIYTCPNRRSSQAGWTEKEDNLLAEAVKNHKGRNWKKIAECMPGRTDVQCLHRWQKVLNPELVKGPWTKEEDERIVELVEIYGSRRWSAIAKSLPGRIGKQCRERWHNHLDPAIKKDAWTEEEDSVLYYYHRKYGNKWAEIARFLPGRTDNAIKNHWNCSVKKKLDQNSRCRSVMTYYGNNPQESFCPPRRITPSLSPIVFDVDSLPENTIWQNSESNCSTELALGSGKSHEDYSESKLQFPGDYRFPYTGERKLINSLGGFKIWGKEIVPSNMDTDRVLVKEDVDSLNNHVDMSPGFALSNALSERIYETPKKRARDAPEGIAGLKLDGSPDPNFLSLSSPGFMEDSYQPNKKTKVSETTENGTNHHLYSTPISRVSTVFCNASTPESLLRNSAMSYKNTPSIIRKKIFASDSKDASSSNGLMRMMADSVSNTPKSEISLERRLEYANEGELEPAAVVP